MNKIMIIGLAALSFFSHSFLCAESSAQFNRKPVVQNVQKSSEAVMKNDVWNNPDNNPSWALKQYTCCSCGKKTLSLESYNQCTGICIWECPCGFSVSASEGELMKVRLVVNAEVNGVTYSKEYGVFTEKQAWHAAKHVESGNDVQIMEWIKKVSGADPLTADISCDWQDVPWETVSSK